MMAIEVLLIVLVVLVLLTYLLLLLLSLISTFHRCWLRCAPSHAHLMKSIMVVCRVKHTVSVRTWTDFMCICPAK